jgi:hypothetical protein
MNDSSLVRAKWGSAKVHSRIIHEDAQEEG